MTSDLTSLIEILQCAAALTGLGYTLWGMWIILNNIVEITGASAEDLRRLVGLIAGRRQISLIAAHLLLVLIGAVSVIMSSTNGGGEPQVFGQVAITRILLIALTVVLATDAVMEQRARLWFEQIAARNLAAKVKKEVALVVEGKTLATGELKIDSTVISPKE